MNKKSVLAFLAFCSVAFPGVHPIRSKVGAVLSIEPLRLRHYDGSFSTLELDPQMIEYEATDVSLRGGSAVQKFNFFKSNGDQEIGKLAEPITLLIEDAQGKRLRVTVPVKSTYVIARPGEVQIVVNAYGEMPIAIEPEASTAGYDRIVEDFMASLEAR